MIDLNEPTVQKWPSIEQLHHVRATLAYKAEELGTELPNIRYRCKIKLDGTNAGVQVLRDGRVFAQSRTRLLGQGNDNSGFRAWVELHKSYFATLASEQDLVIFGEWCGEGIQKRTAISSVGKKLFAVFAIQFYSHHTFYQNLFVEPDTLSVNAWLDHPDIYILPWLEPCFELNFADTDSLRATADSISKYVQEVENCDPWVEATFGVKGIGEGIVLYPMLDEWEADKYRLICDLMFKAKGEKHQVVRQKKAAQIDPEVAKGIDDFGDLVVTTARLEQGLVDLNLVYTAPDMRQMGSFLKWIAFDVHNECEKELEASGLSWKQVNKRITQLARDWYRAQIEKIYD